MLQQCGYGGTATRSVQQFGEQLRSSIFIGPVCYQRLGMTNIKCHSRSPMVLLTRQPPRKVRRGTASGEMERDVLISGGYSALLRGVCFYTSLMHSLCTSRELRNDCRLQLTAAGIHLYKIIDNKSDFARVEVTLCVQTHGAAHRQHCGQTHHREITFFKISF
jgi:hypothetical protein